MKQQLLKFFALLVSVLFFSSLNAQVTINYEQEGAGEPLVSYFDYGTLSDNNIKLVPGETYELSGLKFRKQNINGQWIDCYWFRIKVTTPDKLKSVIVDGTENNEYLSSAKSGGEFSFILTEDKEYNINLKLVYEGEYVEKQWTQKLNSSISGWGGTVKCTYEDKTKGEQTLTLENNGELELDVKPGDDNNYRMRISAELEGGRAVKFITVNGASVKKEYDANGYYDIVVETEKATSNLIVEFGDIPRADMIVNYKVSGNGTTDYYYFADEASTDKREGSFVDGENMFNEMYFSDKYTLYVVPQPAEYSFVGDIKINGIADSAKKEQYEAEGYFTIEKSIPGEEVLLTITYVSEEQEKNIVTIKANPDVDYVIRYSNISAGKQEFYEIKREDVVLELPDNSFCSWTYTNNDDFVVRGLKIDGSSTVSLQDVKLLMLVGNKYELYKKNTYSYNEGKLTKMEIAGPNGPDSYDTYSYDARKRLSWEGHYSYYGATPSLDSQRRYWYDRNSNLLSESYSLGSVVQDSTYYFYSNEKAEDYVYPYDLEEVPVPVYMDYLYNKITGYQKYNLEESLGELVETERYEFNYGDLTSVEAVKTVSEGNVSVVIDGDFGLVFGVKDRFADFVITDLAGRVVLKGNLKSGTFAPYLLNRGVYVLSVEGKSVKFRK